MNSMWELLGPATLETIIMVFASTALAIILGAPVGIVLVMTQPGGLAEKPALYRVLDLMINFMRSIPFVILMIMLIPFTTFVVGVSTGLKGSIIPLGISAAPLVARTLESALMEVDKGVIDAAKAMGSTNKQIIFKVMISEAMPGIISAITLTIISLIGYTAMAGVIGGGGLGNLAIRYGYYRYEAGIMYASVLIIVIFVQIVQWLGSHLAAAINKK